MADQWQTGCWTKALFIALVFAAQVRAQTVERPSVEIGDRWKYETRDLLTNLATSQTERIITAVSDSRIECTENGSPAHYTPSLNPVETPEQLFDPAAKGLQFPFRLGDKWRHDGKVVSKATGMNFRTQYEVTVVGRERITVAAGSYDAFKLVQDGYSIAYSGILSGRSTPFSRTYWYAPDIKAIVKSELAAGVNRSVTELIDSSIKP